MPLLTRWYIKSAFVYLAATLLLALSGIVPLPDFIRYLNPAYFHLYLVGWVTQMIFGVIYWMFPIITRARPRGNEKFGWAIFYLLNGGLLLRVLVEPLLSVSTESGLGWLNVGIWLVIAGTVFRAGSETLFLGRILEMGAVLTFAGHSWRRIVSREGS